MTYISRRSVQMTEICLNFNAHLWKPRICRDCTRSKEEHSGSEDSNASNNCYKSEGTADARQKSPKTFSDRLVAESKPTPVKSDEPVPDCDNRANSSTLSLQSAIELQRPKKRTRRKHDERRFIELVEKQVEGLIAQLNLKDEELDKLRGDQEKMVHYHQTLEKALAEALEYREKRELERQHILTVSRQTPSYWGPNALSQPYREVIISDQSKEFGVIQSLLNATIGQHSGQCGTINGEDPRQFIVKQIRRVHNMALWHEYRFKKDTIIRNNNNQLTDCGSSIYLEANPVLTPLLDKKANEYWLFHGCSADTIPELLHSGYDPRVSNLLGNFGGGFYLAENSSKANQYIPCPECGQNTCFSIDRCQCADQEEFVFTLIVYRVVLGDVHIALKYDREKYRDGIARNGRHVRVRRPPMKANGLSVYDSVMGETIQNGGDVLRHREFVVYDRGQAYPEYVVDFQRSSESIQPPVDLNRVHKKWRHFLKHTFRSVPE